MVLTRWPDFIECIEREKGNIEGREIKKLIRDALTDQDDFIRRQGEKLEFYLNQAATGVMSKTELREHVVNVARLTEMMLPEMKGEVRAGAERLYEGVTKYLINGLLPIL